VKDRAVHLVNGDIEDHPGASFDLVDVVSSEVAAVRLNLELVEESDIVEDRRASDVPAVREA